MIQLRSWDNPGARQPWHTARQYVCTICLTSQFIVHTICPLEIDFDPAKNARNIRERGLSFERAAEFDFTTAFIEVDDRRDYNEIRVTAIGMLGAVLHVLVFTTRGEALRVISFRRANRREVQRYEKATQP